MSGLSHHGIPCSTAYTLQIINRQVCKGLPIKGEVDQSQDIYKGRKIQERCHRQSKSNSFTNRTQRDSNLHEDTKKWQTKKLSLLKTKICKFSSKNSIRYKWKLKSSSKCVMIENWNLRISLKISRNNSIKRYTKNYKKSRKSILTASISLLKLYSRRLITKIQFLIEL